MEPREFLEIDHALVGQVNTSIKLLLNANNDDEKSALHKNELPKEMARHISRLYIDAAFKGRLGSSLFFHSKINFEEQAAVVQSQEGNKRR